MAEIGIKKQIIELVEHAESVAAAIHVAPQEQSFDDLGGELAPDIRDIVKRLDDLQNRCGVGKPNLMKCSCGSPTTPSCRMVASRDFEGVHYILCEKCGGVGDSFHPDLLKTTLLDGYQYWRPRPVHEFSGYDANRDLEFAPAADKDGYAIIPGPSFELMGDFDVRVLVTPGILPEIAIAMLRKVIEQLDAGVVEEMSFADHRKRVQPIDDMPFKGTKKPRSLHNRR